MTLFDIQLVPSNYKKELGFTLLELLVAVAIFAVVMTVAGGALASIIESNRKSRNAMNVMDNMRVVAETMSREIRDGSSYSCNQNPGTNTSCFSNGSFRLSFEKDNGDTVVYRYQNHEITKEENGNTVDMTGENITVDHARFYLYGGAGASTNPQVRIVLQMHAGGEEAEDVELNLQTSAAHRPEPGTINIE